MSNEAEVQEAIIQFLPNIQGYSYTYNKKFIKFLRKSCPSGIDVENWLAPFKNLQAPAKFGTHYIVKIEYPQGWPPLQFGGNKASRKMVVSIGYENESLEDIKRRQLEWLKKKSPEIHLSEQQTKVDAWTAKHLTVGSNKFQKEVFNQPEIIALKEKLNQLAQELSDLEYQNMQIARDEFKANVELLEKYGLNEYDYQMRLQNNLRQIAENSTLKDPISHNVNIAIRLGSFSPSKNRNRVVEAASKEYKKNHDELREKYREQLSSYETDSKRLHENFKQQKEQIQKAHELIQNKVLQVENDLPVLIVETQLALIKQYQPVVEDQDVMGL